MVECPTLPDASGIDRALELISILYPHPHPAPRPVHQVCDSLLVVIRLACPGHVKARAGWAGFADWDADGQRAGGLDRGGVLDAAELVRGEVGHTVKSFRLTVLNPDGAGSKR